MGRHSNDCRFATKQSLGRSRTRSAPPRTARDKRDRIREVLAFASIAPAEIVADFLPFRGYYTRLFAALVGGRGAPMRSFPKT